MMWLPLVTKYSSEIGKSDNFQLYFQNKMACKLAIQCNIVYGFLMGSLSEDTIDVDLKVHTLEGIHTFKKIIRPRLPDAVIGELK